MLGIPAPQPIQALGPDSGGFGPIRGSSGQPLATMRLRATVQQDRVVCLRECAPRRWWSRALEPQIRGSSPSDALGRSPCRSARSWSGARPRAASRAAKPRLVLVRLLTAGALRAVRRLSRARSHLLVRSLAVFGPVARPRQDQARPIRRRPCMARGDMGRYIFVQDS